MRGALAILLLAFGALACEELDSFDQSLLDKFRAAIPESGHLRAPAPTPEAGNGGDDETLFPELAEALADTLNPGIVDLLDLMELLVEAEPATYSSKRREFRWGPYLNEMTLRDDDVFFVSMRRRGENTDVAATDIHRPFEYVLQIDIGLDHDASTITPVAWAGFNPDPEREGIGNGVVFYDFDVHRAWELEHDPYLMLLDRGRMAILFLRQVGSAADPNTSVTLSLRDYLDADAEIPTLEPALDYAWGLTGSASRRYHYLSFAAGVDLDPDGGTLNESMIGQMTFLLNGAGRAEALALGGDIPPGFHANALECWDGAVERQHLVLQLIDESGVNPPSDLVPTEGTSGACSMDALETMPASGTFPQAIRDALQDLLEQGIPLWQDPPT